MTTALCFILSLRMALGLGGGTKAREHAALGSGPERPHRLRYRSHINIRTLE